VLGFSRRPDWSPEKQVVLDRLTRLARLRPSVHKPAQRRLARRRNNATSRAVLYVYSQAAGQFRRATSSCDASYSMVRLCAGECGAASMPLTRIIGVVTKPASTSPGSVRATRAQEPGHIGAGTGSTVVVGFYAASPRVGPSALLHQRRCGQ